MLSQPHPYDRAESVRTSDADLLRLLRDGEPRTVDELKQAFGVTATAIRQRIERLLETGLIERQKEVVGRGRPTFRYALTVEGHRRAGADAFEFAEAMWREIMTLRDSPIRRRLISAIAQRLGRIYAGRLASHGLRLASDPLSASNSLPVGGSLPVGDSFLEERMRLLSQVLSQSQIHAEVHLDRSTAAMLPVLDIGSCPYPTLRDDPQDRSLCKMEEEMLSEALGSRVHLTSCRLDGDHCCQFTPVAVGATD